MTPESKAVAQSQSLFQLEAELVELMQLREEMAEAGEDTVACDQQIQEYAKQELKKVDNIRGYLRYCDMMADAASAEAARLKALEIRWTARHDRLKDICRQTMEFFGLKRVEGQTGSLILKGNGGLAPLKIDNESLVLDELCDYRGWVSGQAWAEMGQIEHDGPYTDMWWKGRQDVQMERTPNHGKIREALKRGDVAGCRLEERGAHLEIK